jgi:hypothetical protein
VVRGVIALQQYQGKLTYIDGRIGIRNFLAAAGIPAVDVTMLGIGFAIVIWFFRSRLTDAETLALLVLAGVL